MKIPASVGILTYNSAGTLRQALESVRDFEDIILCDGGSTDGTLEIGKSFGARILPQDPSFSRPEGGLNDFAGVRNQCLAAATYDWFLYIDSDETISDGLRENIRAIVARTYQEGEVLVYRIPIGIMMDGRYIKYSSNYPGYQFRFFNKKSGAQYMRPVHERIFFDETQVKVGTLKHPWYIHTTREHWKNYVQENSYYLTLQVQKACASTWGTYFRGTVLSHLRMSLGVVLKASRQYVLHGFRDAIPVQGEVGRALMPLLLIGKTLRCKLSRAQSHA